MLFDKQLSMIGFGFPTDSVCTQLINKFVEPHNHVPCNFHHSVRKDIIEQNATYPGHRYSNYETDCKMVDKLKKIYGTTFDGYILPNTVCSCWMKYFAPEVCLFDLTKTEIEVLEEFPVNKTITGGAQKQDDMEAYFIDQQRKKHAMGENRSDWVRICNESRLLLIKDCGYTPNELKYDKQGILLLPSLKERSARRQAIEEQKFKEKYQVIPNETTQRRKRKNNTKVI